MRRLAAALIAASCALVLGTASASAQAPHIALGGDTVFPARTLVVSGIGSGGVTPSTVHVSENGRQVSGLTIQPLSAGRRGDLGVVLVIDRSPSMAGAPSIQALQAARALAAQRLGSQELGIVTFAAQPLVALPLTIDPTAISAALQQLPAVQPGTHILPALALAIRQLADAHVAAGAVILLSDGADREAPGSLTAASVAALARAAHVAIFTVGLRDRYYTPSSMNQLAAIGGGQFFEAVASGQLQRIFGQIQEGLVASWLVRYRSTQPLGKLVTVVLRVAGVAQPLTLSYESPPVPRRAPAPARHRPRQPFWESATALILVVAICALLFGFAAWVALRQRSGPASARTRVHGFVSSPTTEPARRAQLATSFSDRTRTAFSNSSWWPAFVESVDIAGIEQAPEQLILMAGAAAAIAGAMLGLLTHSVVLAMLPIVAAPFGLRAYVQNRVRRQRRRFSDVLPSHLEEVAVSIRGGRSLIEAMTAVTESAEEPLRREFERALRDENLGRPLEDVMRVISARMESEGVDQVAVVAAMHRRTGSSVSEALDRVAEGARERADLQRELAALTAQGRLARWILTFLPPVILLIMQVISPRYVRPLLHTTAGVVALVLAGVMVVIGSLVMKRIVNIEV